MADSSPGELVVKRTLVTLSHVIERAALVAEDDGPLVVVSLFQRLPYFRRESEVYRKLSGRADAVVVGFVDDHRPGLAGSIDPVLLTPQEPLAREWTIVVLSRLTGAHLVAYDEERVSSSERTLEAGRLFSAHWGFGQAAAAAELSRLRQHLADRIPPGSLSAIDTVLDLPHEADARASRTTAAFRVLVGELEAERRRSTILRNRLEVMSRNDEYDDGSGLPNPAFLRRWIGSSYAGEHDPLPLGLVLVSLEGLDAAFRRYAGPAYRETLLGVAAALTRLLGPADRAVRLSSDEFLVVAPGTSLDYLCRLAQGINADLDGLQTGYPYLPVRPALAAIVSRERPLPLDSLRSAATWARAEGVPVAAYGL